MLSNAKDVSDRLTLSSARRKGIGRRSADYDSMSQEIRDSELYSHL